MRQAPSAHATAWLFSSVLTAPASIYASCISHLMHLNSASQVLLCKPSCTDGISLVRLCAVGWARFEPNRRRGSIWRHEDGRAVKHVGTVSCVPLLANVALFSMAELKDAKFRLRSLSTSTLLASPNSEAKFQLQIRDSHPEAASKLSGMWTLFCRHAFCLGQSPTISTSRRLFGLRHCFRL